MVRGSGVATVCTGAVFAGLIMSSVSAQEIQRHPIPGSDFPIAEAVTVPSNAEVVYLSGKVPEVVDEDAPDGSREAYGDTEMQTASVLRRIEHALERRGLDFGDVVRFKAFLVGDPKKGGEMDFSGFMEAYTRFFDTDDQPHVPARSVVEVAGLAREGWLVEIEVTAARSE